MSTDFKTIQIRTMRVEVVRKNIKNLHIGVYPPNGRVRVAAPLAVSDDAVRTAVIGKIAWIHRQREKLAAQPRQAAREAVSGESHYIFGHRYRLRVIETAGRPRVVLRSKTRLELHISPRVPIEERIAVLERWYRRELRSVALPIVERWSKELGVSVAHIGIKRMKTKWGSCNPEASRVWLNSELARKPLVCLEYIIVHELVHLLERSHGERFVRLMDTHLPDWRARRRVLNSGPLANETWTY